MGWQDAPVVDQSWTRSDGTQKGMGFLGPLKAKDGRTSTEISIGVNLGGKEMEIPSLVPTLNKEEIDHLLSGGKPTDAIVSKAVQHARERIRLGKSVFADSGDATKNAWESAPVVGKTDPAPSTPPQPSMKDRLVSAGLKGFMGGGPALAIAGMAGAGMQKAEETMTEGAYDAGGKVAEIGSRVGLSPEAAASAGVAANVALQSIPALLGGKGATASAPAMEAAAKGLMHSSLKPVLKDLKSGRAAQAIDTMLEEGVNVTKGGLEKLRTKISELNYEIADKIRNSPATVDKYAAWNAVKDTLDKFTRQVNSKADTAKIQEVWHEFLEHPMITGQNMPVQLAQDLKQGTYKVLSKKYGEVGSAETEAQKAIARGLKDEISNAVPGVAGLNAQESALLNALKVAERRVLVDANKNPGGLAWLAANPAAWAAFMADRSPLFKSLAARMAYAGRERIPEATVGIGIAGAEALSNNR